MKIIKSFVILFMLPFAAHALNTSFLGNSAISFYTKEDWSISRNAQIRALNQTEDGSRLVWANPKTGSHGVYLPVNTLYANGALCRDLEIRHSANQVNEKARYRFCKLHNEWKIV